MIALFGQVWILCVIAFLAGSAVTWLLFVRTPRRRHASPRRHTRAPRAPERASSLPRRARPERPEPPPSPAEPALANLDTRGREATSRGSGSSAAGALDRLGVAGASHRPENGPAPQIPAQGGPVDEPAGGDSR